MSLRTGLKLQALRARPLAAASTSCSRAASTFRPSGQRRGGAEPLERPQRPDSPFFYTGRPQINDAISALHDVMHKSERVLREQYIWPLPSGFPRPPPLDVSWRAPTELPNPTPAELNRLAGVLNKLGHVRQVAIMSGSYDVAERIDAVTQPYVSRQQVELKSARSEKKANEAEQPTDEFGRAYAVGKRKESSARVWIVPSAVGAEYLEPKTEVEATAEAKEAEQAEEDAAPAKEIPVPTSQVLVNHLPLPQHFGRHVDRDTVLRPLRVTGLLGAYNIFALVRGGGSSGQSQAISLAVARALVRLHPEARDVLYNDNALYRDPRVVERKKTNLLKARKARAWVKR